MRARSLSVLFRCWLLCLLAWPWSPVLADLDGEGEELAPGVRLLWSEFGMWERLEESARFKVSSVITIKPGDSFGWRFRVAGDEEKIKMRVALELPAPPRTWTWNGEVVEKESSDGAMKISPDRRTAMVEKDVAISGGWAGDFWTFDHGDPYGPHTVRVFVGKKLVRIFRFKVLEPKK